MHALAEKSFILLLGGNGSEVGGGVVHDFVAVEHALHEAAPYKDVKLHLDEKHCHRCGGGSCGWWA